MDDETLGGKIVPTNLSIGYSRADYATVGARARELLAKPVATREGVAEWIGRLQHNRGIPHLTADDIFAALTHFAPPRQRMMIKGMTEKELFAAMFDEWAADGRDGASEICEIAARVAHRLATTPAPEVDADAEALAWEFHKAALVEIGAKNANDLWASFKDHQRLGWRAVAAMEKGNG